MHPSTALAFTAARSDYAKANTPEDACNRASWPATYFSAVSGSILNFNEFEYRCRIFVGPTS
jgi:hypothetical protein